MTVEAERYLKAPRRGSTQRRYQQALEHFESEWGGLLPASTLSVVNYLAAHAEQFSSSTLRTHLAALAQWHREQGFGDPTKAPQVRDVLRGIQAEHARPVPQAEALTLTALEACIAALDRAAASRNRALGCGPTATVL